MRMHIHSQLRKYFDLMASIVRRVLEQQEFSEKDFRSVFEDQNGEPYLSLKKRLPHLMFFQYLHSFHMLKQPESKIQHQIPYLNFPNTRHSFLERYIFSCD